ncbi:MAG: alanine--tRNA ligase [Clostridia bacterium]
MKAIEIRNKYIEFFVNRGHFKIASASLIPENDPTVLFTTAGMHPLVMYLNGSVKHPISNKLVSYQKCVRTGDIDEVGDNRHLTFFEMLGNWSIGEYFKEESIKMSFEFLTKVLNIPVNKLSVTCFAGNENIPRDIVSHDIWKSLGINDIYYLDSNIWGPAGITGPCGSDTEIFYDTGIKPCSKNCNPDCDCGKYVEIWNNVFMEYNKGIDGNYTLLDTKCVDTGLGLERMTYLMQGKNNVFETELFTDIIDKINEYATVSNINSARIISDHMRTAVMIINDGVVPSNVDQGYILRRVIRRAIRHLRKLGINIDNLNNITLKVIDVLSEMYKEVLDKKEDIILEINKEKNRFMNTLIAGEKEFNKLVIKLKNENIEVIDSKNLFRLYDTFGYPPELTRELALENNLSVDFDGFDIEVKNHALLSKTDGKFKGGLADNKEQTTKYHTATHLLHSAMKKVLGDHITQKGANITEERIRFDFTHNEKISDVDVLKIENMVNDIIDKSIPVVCEEMKLEKARQIGANGIFNDKYLDKVFVYTIGDFSCEICGGPHVDNTNKLDKIKIIKQEAVSSGVRRIKAVFIKE